MLGKLLKYEFKATARIFLLAYLVLVVLAGVNAAILAFKPATASAFSIVFGVMSTLSTTLFVIAAGGVFILTLVIIVMRFYRMLGTEGYLWFTLPVTPAQHIFGKLIPSAVWTICTSVVMIGSIGLATWTTDWRGQLSSAWQTLVAQGYRPAIWVVIVPVFILVSLLMEVMLVYASIAVGPSLLKSNRLGGSVLAFVIGYFILEFVNLIGVLIVSLMLKNLIGPLLTFGPGGVSSVNIGIIDAPMVNHAALVFGGYFGVEYVVLAVVSFLVTRHFIGRKLNLL